MGTRRAVLSRVATALAVLVAAPPARAQAEGFCPPQRIPQALSEARAARWLVGEDLTAQSSLDAHRAYVNGLMAEYGVTPPAWEVFAGTSAGLQYVPGLDACSTRGREEDAALNRYRAMGVLAVTHVETGLHARVSATFAVDELTLDVANPGAVPDRKGDVDSETARAGYRQGLVAVRVGHEKWGRLVLGRITREVAYASPANGVSLPARLPVDRSAPFFYGVDLPVLRTSLLAMSDDGKPELVQLLVRDLSMPGSNAALTLGPTYIREERQVVGLFRVRGNALGPLDFRHRRPKMMAVGDTYVSGDESGAAFAGPMAELSFESGDARLRHARVRLEAAGDFARVARGGHGREFGRGSVYLDGTVFRSRFFETSGPSPSSPRSAAFGGALGVNFDFEYGPVALAFDGLVGVNRPELLALLPSADGRPEVRALLGLRLEN